MDHVAHPPRVQQFLNYLQFERHFSSYTSRCYGADLRQFCQFLLGIPAEIMPDDVDSATNGHSNGIDHTNGNGHANAETATATPQPPPPSSSSSPKSTPPPHTPKISSSTLPPTMSAAISSSCAKTTIPRPPWPENSPPSAVFSNSATAAA